MLVQSNRNGTKKLLDMLPACYEWTYGRLMKLNCIIYTTCAAGDGRARTLRIDNQVQQLNR